MATDKESLEKVGLGEIEYKRYRFQPSDLKAVNVKESTFEGFSAGIGNIDGGDDIIEPGAFTKTIEQRVSNSRVKFLDHHRTDSTARLLGKVVAAEERKTSETERKELASLLDINLDATPTHRLWSKFLVSSKRAAQDTLLDISEEILDGLSIGFRPVRVEFVAKDDDNGDDMDPELAWLFGRGVRHLKEVAWWETSAVIWGMNAAALVVPESVKATLDKVAGLQNSGEELLNEKQILYAIRALKDLLGDDQEAEMRIKSGDLEELTGRFEKVLQNLAKLDLTPGAKDAAGELEEIADDLENTDTEDEEKVFQISVAGSLETINTAVEVLQGLADQLETMISNDESDADEDAKADEDADEAIETEDTEDGEAEDAGEAPKILDEGSDPKEDGDSDEPFDEEIEDDALEQALARLTLMDVSH